MELKIQCDCGTKYKFEFEPVNGRVPFEVRCPGCGADATQFANSRVQQILSTPSAPSAPTGLRIGSAPPPPPSAPAAPAAPVAAPLAQSAPTQSKLRIANAPSHTPEQESAPEIASASAPAPAAPRASYMPTINPYSSITPEDEGLSKNFFLGLLGALLGVIVGCAIWYLVFHISGSNWRIMALVVGICGGFGAKLLSKDEGSGQLGMITCVLVLVGVMFTAYTIGRNRVHGLVDEVEGGFYKHELKYAKRAVAAVPNGTEEEVRAFLAKDDATDGEKHDPASVRPHQVWLFQEVKLAQYKELASGKISEKDFPVTLQRWSFDESVAEAKHILATMPNESDAEIRAHLANRFADWGEKANPQSITSEQVAGFRQDSLPELKALASGQKQFEPHADLPSAKDELAKAEDSDKGGWIKVLYFFSGWGIGGVGLMFLTMGLTYKICTHA